MAYQAEMSRANPSVFVFLIDQSGSMADAFGGDEAGKKKADGVADAVNRLLQNLVIKCAKPEGVRDYYHVGVIGYGASVGPAFSGSLVGRELVPISEIANMPARVEERMRRVDDGAGGLVDQRIKFPVWFDHVANGGTPMSQALGLARRIISDWLDKPNPNPGPYQNRAHKESCFPPVAINITDGEATDGDPTSAADSLRSLATNDGNVLLYTCHLSSTRTPKIEFPDSESQLPDEPSRLMFRISSPLHETARAAAREYGYNVTEGTKGFVFQSDLVSLIAFLDIGTRPSNLR